MAGNGGTTALEIFEDLPKLDALVVPVGGGGLANGVGVVARAKAPGVKVIGVNTDASPGMWLSRRDGKAHLRMDPKPTIAEGLEGGVSCLGQTAGLSRPGAGHPAQLHRAGVLSQIDPQSLTQTRGGLIGSGLPAQGGGARRAELKVQVAEPAQTKVPR